MGEFNSCMNGGGREINPPQTLIKRQYDDKAKSIVWHEKDIWIIWVF